MSHIHFIGGEKGGVGKSVMARLLAQYFIDRSAPFAALDGDGSHAALLRHYADFSQPVDLASPESADQILDRALGADRSVLVDLPAQSARALEGWIFGANVLGLAREFGVPITFWYVSDGGFASVNYIEQALSRFGAGAGHVVVRNHGRSRDFRQLDGSPLLEKLGELAGRVIDLPELDSAAMFKLDRAGLSFWAGAHAKAGPTVLGPLERERVRLWLEQAYRALEELTGLV